MNKLIKQVIHFVGISGVGWIIDFIIYNVLTSIINFNVDVSNMISSLIGVSFVFIMSKRKIFISNSKIDIKIKYVIYILYQIVLIFSASCVMLLLKDYLLSLDISFIVNYVDVIVKIMITPFTMLINFIVMKCLIEKI